MSRISRIKDAVHYGVGGVIGGLIGEGINLYGKYSADVNFKVRPELANLQWYEALVSGHFTDWLYKMAPEPTTIASIVILALLGVATTWYFKKELSSL